MTVLRYTWVQKGQEVHLGNSSSNSRACTSSRITTFDIDKFLAFNLATQCIHQGTLVKKADTPRVRDNKRKSDEDTKEKKSPWKNQNTGKVKTFDRQNLLHKNNTLDFSQNVTNATISIQVNVGKYIITISTERVILVSSVGSLLQ